MTSFSTVVMFDKSGTGLSDRVPATDMADADRRLEDLLAVMDAVGLERATLLATADGAHVALLCAARHPFSSPATRCIQRWRSRRLELARRATGRSCAGSATDCTAVRPSQRTTLSRSVLGLAMRYPCTA